MEEFRAEIQTIDETKHIKESLGIIFKLIDKLGKENKSQTDTIQMLITTGEEVEQKLHKRIDKLQKKVNDLEYEIGRIRRSTGTTPPGYFGLR